MRVEQRACAVTCLGESYAHTGVIADNLDKGTSDLGIAPLGERSVAFASVGVGDGLDGDELGQHALYLDLRVGDGLAEVCALGDGDVDAMPGGVDGGIVEGTFDHGAHVDEAGVDGIPFGDAPRCEAVEAVDDVDEGLALQFYTFSLHIVNDLLDAEGAICVGHSRVVTCVGCEVVGFQPSA